MCLRYKIIKMNWIWWIMPTNITRCKGESKNNWSLKHMTKCAFNLWSLSQSWLWSLYIQIDEASSLAPKNMLT